MKNNKLFLTVLGLFIAFPLFAQQNVDHYLRSSLYSILVSHPDKKMNDEITTAYMNINTPDKFNDHDLSVKCITTQSTNPVDVKMEVSNFVIENNIGRRLVAKWFDRDRSTGGFDGDLIVYRGQYNASDIDVQTAKQSKRGMSMLDDAGYELIGNTFVIFNDITYIDKEEGAQQAKKAFNIIGNISSVLLGGSSIVTQVASLGASISDVIAGFTVKITTYLYQLNWNDEIAGTFYNDYYFDKNDLNPEMRKAFDADDVTFGMRYVGSYDARSSKTVMRGIYKPEEVFRKVCARAIDNNIVELQKEYDEFKVKVPLYSTDPITVKIGKKEGVSVNSKYEVLVTEIDEATGVKTFKRVGIIQPLPGQIWDNRYMAAEERADGANLDVTTFKKVSGGTFYEGMLVREIKYIGGTQQ